LRTAVAIASAASTAIPAQALQHLCVAAAATAFRSMLRTLAQLQPLSGTAGGSVGANEEGMPAVTTRRAAASLLLELPPLFSRLMDALQAPIRLVAWVRVAGELLAESCDGAQTSGSAWSSGAGDPIFVRCWALRFCTRCVERALPALPPEGSSEFPAWEVFSELLQVRERIQERQAAAKDDSASSVGGEEAAWAADMETWSCTLEKAACAVTRRCPAQARAFWSVASCTGSTLPTSLMNLLDERKAIPPGKQA
jgi:hypothetical protein